MSQPIPRICLVIACLSYLWCAASAQVALLPGDTPVNYGRSIAIDGNTALVGAMGGAYVFYRSGEAWGRQAKLLPSTTQGSFGVSVAVSGNTALVGAWAEGGDGRAYVFLRNGSAWSQQAKLAPPDAGTSARFGHSVAIDGDTAAIGCPFNTWTQGGQTIIGCVYVFVRVNGTWTQQAKLYNPSAPRFGGSVALSGDTLLVGRYFDAAYDATYNLNGADVFVRSGTTWTAQASLDGLLPAGRLSGGEWFGQCVDLDGDTAVVGAPYDDGPPSAAFAGRTGSVFVFTRNGDAWGPSANLVGHDSGNGDTFGWDVGLDAGALVAGAPRDDETRMDSGTAFVFTLGSAGWTERTKLACPPTAQNTYFGQCVDIGPGTPVVTALYHPASAYAFEHVPPDPDVSIARASEQSNLTNALPISFTITFSNPVVGFDTGPNSPDVGFDGTGDVMSYTVSGSGASYTLTVTSVVGDGTVNPRIPAGVCTDGSGNPNRASTLSNGGVTFDTTPPVIGLGAPVPTETDRGPVSFAVNYTGADRITLSDSDVTLNKTGTVNGTILVSGSGTSTRTVTISGIAGTGTLSISLAAGTASDWAGNLAPGAGPSATFTVDNTAPTVTIGAPSTLLTRGGPVVYAVTYSDAANITLDAADVTLEKTGTATGDLAVSGSDATTRHITLSKLAGNGTLGISIAVDTAVNVKGHPAPAAGPSVLVTVDNTPPLITLVGESTVEVHQNAPYADPGATAIDAVDGDLTSKLRIDAASVDTAIPGAYTVTYAVTDAAGNTAHAQRAVTVLRDAALSLSPWPLVLALLLAGAFAARQKRKG